MSDSTDGCICTTKTIQRPSGPVKESLLHPTCPYHGAVSDPDTWTKWHETMIAENGQYD